MDPNLEFQSNLNAKGGSMRGLEDGNSKAAPFKCHPDSRTHTPSPALTSLPLPIEQNNRNKGLEHLHETDAVI